MKIFPIEMARVAVVLCAALLFVPSPLLAAQSFLYSVEVLDRAAIKNLDNAALLDSYINVMVELEASTLFHRSSGFNPKDFVGYKKMIRYRVDLIQEILRRELDLPQITPGTRKDNNDTDTDG